MYFAYAQLRFFFLSIFFAKSLQLTTNRKKPYNFVENFLCRNYE